MTQSPRREKREKREIDQRRRTWAGQVRGQTKEHTGKGGKKVKAKRREDGGGRGEDGSFVGAGGQEGRKEGSK